MNYYLIIAKIKQPYTFPFRYLILKTHIKISIILIKKNFQRCAVAHSVAFYVYNVEVGSLLLWKFGLGSYSRFKIHWCLAPQFAV